MNTAAGPVPPTILIVEDESKIADVLAAYLHREGFRTHHLADGDEVLPWLATHDAALLLLDVMLPGQSGLDVCRKLRGQEHPAAIIMITARVEEIDRLLGLELGADDYICKPFSPREVVARVKAVLRRTQAPPPTAPSAASPGHAVEYLHGLTMDRERLQATLRGRPLVLTPLEFQLLEVLAAQPGRIFSRAQLMDAMYTDDRIVADRTVDSHVKKLRRKLDDAMPEHELIGSVYGVGYRFE